MPPITSHAYFSYLATDFSTYLTFILLSASKTINSNPPFTSFNCPHSLRYNSLKFFNPDRFGNTLIDSQPDIDNSSNDSNLPSPLTSVNCVHPETSNVFSFMSLDRSGNSLIDRHPFIDSDSNNSNISRPVTLTSSLHEINPKLLRFLRLERSGNSLCDMPDKHSSISLVNMESEDGNESVNLHPTNTKDSNFTME
ncbi:hypothetical protein LINGRAHAP2_LOCUS23645 [Linum grandiflorum]